MAEQMTPQEAAARKQRSREDWTRLLSDEGNLRCLQELYISTGAESELPVDESLKLAFAAGRRSVGLSIRNVVREIDTALLTVMERLLTAPPADPARGDDA